MISFYLNVDTANILAIMFTLLTLNFLANKVK
jgi:hypothetical protein